MTEEMTLEEYRKSLLQKPSKYGAKKTECDGYVFDSKRESERYSELKIREAAGEIFGLELQPRFECVVNGKKICTYIADFRYKEYNPPENIKYIQDDGSVEEKVVDFTGFKTIVEDVKGMKTPAYKLKKKLVEALHNIEIKEIT